MVALVLGAAGSALGAGFGGTILGLSGAAIGGMISSAVGSVADAWIVGSMTPNQRVEGARLESLRVASATVAVMPNQLACRLTTTASTPSPIRPQTSLSRSDSKPRAAPKPPAPSTSLENW